MRFDGQAGELPTRPAHDDFEMVAGDKDDIAQKFYHHATANRTESALVFIEAIRKAYPDSPLTVVPATNVNFLLYAANGFVDLTPVSSDSDLLGQPLTYKNFLPSARRMGGPGLVADDVRFGKFLLKWKNEEWIMYYALGRDDSQFLPRINTQYLLGSDGHKVDELIKECGTWLSQLHEEIWVFDQGFWSKSKELYESISHSRWEDVILEKEEKDKIIGDVTHFFDGQDRYNKFRVPWKRGVIYYGPPGNGKTISIKAMMNTMYKRPDPIPTCYVRSLSSFQGPEFSIKSIFQKARQEAPCLLVFEDLDSLVTDNVRSYFLNEVDGLRANDGVMMIGSTNHLDRLDPGISKRPSRFDRKFLFDKPDKHGRLLYAEYWRKKLGADKSDIEVEVKEDIEFPKGMCAEVARITEGFSFAYMQEAFIASLLAIASDEEGKEVNSKQLSEWLAREGDKYEDVRLWRELRRQVKALREEI